jgi:TolA-binding protein
MSTLTPTRKVSRRHELREDKVITFSARVLDFFESNRRLVYSIFGVIIVFVAVSLYYSQMQGSKNLEATSEMAEAIRRFEAGEFAAALDGDISFKGLLEVIDDYGSTDAGNLARFYAASALFQEDEYDRALTFFEDFKKDANYLGASAIAGEAAVYEVKGDFDRAAKLYLRAANLLHSVVVAPDYLLNAGRAFENAGDATSAKRAYEQIKEDYPDAPQARDIDFYIGRASAAS